MTNLDPARNRGRRAEQTLNGGLPPSGDKAAAAAYIAEMSSTLADLARGYDIETLGYLLELARLEAETISHKAAHS
jgi:hypothetical protein